MPDSVAAVSPTTVLPYSLAKDFQQIRMYAVDQNRYPDGTVQSSVISSSSRKRWILGRPCTAAQLAALRAFFIARTGQAQEFWFYDPSETIPKFSYDNTGVATVGRYAVRFDGQFQQSLKSGPKPAQFALIEIA